MPCVNVLFTLLAVIFAYDLLPTSGIFKKNLEGTAQRLVLYLVPLASLLETTKPNWLEAS